MLILTSLSLDFVVDSVRHLRCQILLDYLFSGHANYCVFFFFFFSSRRRHTRCSRDWSSDVCSSDLAGPTRLAFEKPTGAEEEENPFRQAGGPRAVPGTYAATLSAGGRTQTATVTVEPDPFLGGDPARFAAQLRSGLAWRNAVSALNEMLNRLLSLETQLKNVQQAVRDNVKGDSSRTAPVTRAGRDLGRKLKELKDSLYNADVQRDAGQDDI